MKNFFCIMSVLFLALSVTGCGVAVTPVGYETQQIEIFPLNATIEADGEAEYDTNANKYENANGKTTIHIPRELFFPMGWEEVFIGYVEYSGGIVAELAEDVTTFWRNHPENAGTAYLEVTFSYEDLERLAYEIDEDVYMYLTAVADAFDSIVKFENEICEAVTRFIFTAYVEEIASDGRIVGLLDFTFPDIGILEYLRRIFFQYDMTYLEAILFYLEDVETQERFMIYSFLDDAPLGLSMRHNIEADE